MKSPALAGLLQHHSGRGRHWFPVPVFTDNPQGERALPSELGGGEDLRAPDWNFADRGEGRVSFPHGVELELGGFVKNVLASRLT